MELTQQDYDERRARLGTPDATDEDRRLVKHYEQNGFSPKTDPAPEPAGRQQGTTDGGSAADTLTVDRGTGRGARRGK